MKHVKLYEQFKSVIPSITTGVIQSMNDDDFLEYLESLSAAGNYEEIASAISIMNKSNPEIIRGPRVDKIIELGFEAIEKINPDFATGFGDEEKGKKWDELKKESDKIQARLDSEASVKNRIANKESDKIQARLDSEASVKNRIANIKMAQRGPLKTSIQRINDAVSDIKREQLELENFSLDPSSDIPARVLINEIKMYTKKIQELLGDISGEMKKVSLIGRVMYHPGPGPLTGMTKEEVNKLRDEGYITQDQINKHPLG